MLRQLMLGTFTTATRRCSSGVRLVKLAGVGHYAQRSLVGWLDGQAMGLRHLGTACISCGDPTPDMLGMLHRDVRRVLQLAEELPAVR